MSDRRGSSRSLGVVKQVAVYVRGGLRCVHCTRRLRAARTDGGRDTCTATIDHWNGDGHDHRPENLLPSCRSCNFARRWPEMWPFHLCGFGQTPARAEARARAQLAAPLDYEAGRELARRWHPGRLEQIEECRLRYKARQAGRLAPVGDFPPAEENAA